MQTLIELYDPKAGNQKQLNIMLQMIAERRQQLEQRCSTSSRCGWSWTPREHAAAPWAHPAAPADRTPPLYSFIWRRAPPTPDFFVSSQSLLTSMKLDMFQIRTPPHAYLKRVAAAFTAIARKHPNAAADRAFLDRE